MLAWDIYRHWDLWVQSCCPAEEARIRRKGRQFDDPEEFRHADQVSMPSSPSAATEAIATASEEQASGSPDNQLTSSEGDIEPTQQQQEQPLGTSWFSNADDGTGDSFAEDGQPAPPPPDQHYDQGNDTDAELGEREPRKKEVHSLERPQDDQQADQEEEEEEEFRPKATMSARAVVRARRQWALRRARRREGPNEANQLELGGGSPADAGIREAWVETVVKVAADSSRSGALAGGSGNGGEGGVRSRGGAGGGGGGSGVVELLVSLIWPGEGYRMYREIQFDQCFITCLYTVYALFTGILRPQPTAASSSPKNTRSNYSSTIPSPCHQHVKLPRNRSDAPSSLEPTRLACAEKETTGKSFEPPPRP